MVFGDGIGYGQPCRFIKEPGKKESGCQSAEYPGCPAKPKSYQNNDEQEGNGQEGLA